MAEYLIGIGYHDPETYSLWERGLIEDYESSTGLFIEANTAEEAVAWGKHVGQALLAHVFRHTTPAGPPAESWIEESVEDRGWKHCVSFFQRVRVGEMPNLAEMTTEAYERWLDR